MVFDIIGIDLLAVIALTISIMAFAEKFRGSQRARQEANILTLSRQLNETYGLMDDNLARAISTRGKARAKKVFDRSRFVMMQRFHIHLDTLTIMIKMEREAFRSRVFGRSRYYDELVRWYCCVHKLYNDLLDSFGVKDSGFLHDGLKDPHRAIDNKPPAFLSRNKFAQEYHSMCTSSPAAFISKN